MIIRCIWSACSHWVERKKEMSCMREKCHAEEEIVHGEKNISSSLKEDLHTEKNIIRPSLPDVMQV